MRLSLAVQTPDVPGIIPVALLMGTLEEKLAKAARFGAHGVELITVAPDQLDVFALRRLLNSFQLQVAAIGTGGLAFSMGLTLLNRDPEISSQALTRLYELVHFAARVGADLVTIGSFRGKAAGVIGGGLPMLADMLRPVADYAQKKGVRLAIEALNRYEADLINTAQEGLQFLDDFNHPAVGLLLDTYHVNIEEASFTLPFHQALRAGKLFHVHLGENHRRYPGSGLIDFPSIVSTLIEEGYGGFLSAELLAYPDPDTAAERTLSYMRSIMEPSSCV